MNTKLAAFVIATAALILMVASVYSSLTGDAARTVEPTPVPELAPVIEQTLTHAPTI